MDDLTNRLIENQVPCGCGGDPEPVRKTCDRYRLCTAAREVVARLEDLTAERDEVVRLNFILAARQTAWHEQLVLIDPLAPLRALPDTEIGDPVAPIPAIRPEKLTALLDRLAAEERRGQMLYAENQRLRAQVELAESIRAHAVQDALAAFHKRGGGNG